MPKTGEEELKTLTTYVNGLDDAIKEAKDKGLIVNMNAIDNIFVLIECVTNNLNSSPKQYPEYSVRIEKLNELKQRMINIKSKLDSSFSENIKSFMCESIGFFKNII